MKYWAWFDVHRARLWQVCAASLIVGAFTLIVFTILLALVT